MAKGSITREQVAAIVAKRKAGVTRAAIADETGLGKNIVSSVLTARGLSKTDPATKKRYQEVVRGWIAKAEANGSAPNPKAKSRAAGRKGKARAKAAS